MPQDVRISPDGTMVFVADMHADGVHIVDVESFTDVWPQPGQYSLGHTGNMR